MANKKLSGDWERTLVEEWAFSVAALGWPLDRYWQCSRYEFLEIYKAYAKLNGIKLNEEMTDANAEALSSYLENTFGGSVNKEKKNV